MTTNTPTLQRFPVVRSRVGLPKSSVYALIAKGKFPKPIQIGPRTVAWPSDAIDAWIAERIASAKKASA